MSGGGCICAICYEDVVPANELLQTIVACGHVFHELCLQQWIEFCPNGRKPTCPLCKQSCGVRDVHRLYFQSSADSHKQDALQIAPSKSTPLDANTSEVDRARFSRLEAKVQVLTNACQASKEQILELEGKEAKYLEQLELLNVGRSKAKKDIEHLTQSLAETRVELRRSTALRQEMLERNAKMAKDIAVYQLATDVNLSEDDMLRLVSVDRGSANKDDIIDMMTKSLYLRNRAFKELMHKCQELGMGESRAEQKSEKLTEQLKRMKTRLQELANVEEEKENAVMRSLARSAKGHRSRTGAASGPLTPQDDGISVRYQPNIFENVVSLSANSESQKTGERKEAKLKSPPKIPLICLDDDVNATETETQGTRVKKPKLVVGSMDMVHSARSINGEPNLTRGAWEDSWEDSSHLYSDYRGTPNADYEVSTVGKGSPDEANWTAGELDSTEPDVPFGGAQTLDSGTRSRIGVDGQRSYEESYPDAGASSTQTMRPKITIGLDGDIDNVDILGRRPTLPIRQELGLGQEAAPFTRLQPVITGQMFAAPVVPPRSDGSTFIVSGADGRGGRVTVLKPPRICAGGIPSLLGAQRAKRLKTTSHVAGTRPAALKIEHFFGRG